MATYKTIAASDVKTAQSTLNQLVDILQLELSGNNTRRKYQVYVTGGVGPGITSSLFHTVYDQNYSLQTANPMLDLTVGLFISSSTALSNSTGLDTANKRLYASQSVMMREKTDVYRQFAQTLLGRADAVFTTPYAGSGKTNIDEALFISFKRLFSRDAIKKESFAMRMYTTATLSHPRFINSTNLDKTTTTGSTIFTDVGAATTTFSSPGGTVGTIVNSADTNSKCGLLFYDKGVLVMDMKRIMSGGQHVSGVIGAMNANAPDAGHGVTTGKITIGGSGSAGSNPLAKFIPDLMVSASIDDIVDHIASCRFQSGSETAITFQNETQINSTLFFCRATADEFNYSSNPTFTNSDDRIVVIDQGQESTQRTFSFVTTVGLYDANNNLLAVAKLSRPVEKNDEKDLTVRVRLDF